MNLDVRWVQTRLRALGFDPGPIDGVRGPRTDAAIIAFKKSIGLRARAYVGPLTQRALRAGNAAANADLPWMAAGYEVLGVHEARDTAVLKRWFDRSVRWIDPREIPWCGAFVATVFRYWKSDIALPENPLGARNWQTWGQATTPRLGALLVFWRGARSGWKGHAGFYVGEDATHFHVLGGNQANAVTVTRIAKTRLLSSRWPPDSNVQTTPIQLTPSGVPITTNEA